jgi:hypothetical protein
MKKILCLIYCLVKTPIFESVEAVFYALLWTKNKVA